MKRSELLSPAYLDWVRSQPCHFGTPACGRSQAHHYPPKGRMGFTHDLSVIPVCAREHKRCHGETIVEVDADVRLEPIPQAQQHLAVLVTFWRFWEVAPEALKRTVLADILERDGRRFVVPL